MYNHKPLSYDLLQREAVRIACQFGLEPDYSNTNGFQISKSFQFNCDVFHDTYYLNYRNKTVGFYIEDLLMSIDDFADRILRPFLLSILNNDLKFIHLDCS